MKTLLECRHLRSGYERIEVLRDVELTVGTGEFVCLLGRNGVGKTTLLKTILGEIKPFSGAVVFDGLEIMGRSVHTNVQQGTAFVPEDSGVFKELTVFENLQVAQSNRSKEHSPEILLDEFPILKERARLKAGFLSGGELRILGTAMALSSKPRLLIIDEFSEGLQPRSIDLLLGLLKKMKTEHQLSVLMVEQSLTLALETNDRAYVLEKGQIVLNQDTATLSSNTSALVKHLAL